MLSGNTRVVCQVSGYGGCFGYRRFEHWRQGFPAPRNRSGPSSTLPPHQPTVRRKAGVRPFLHSQSACPSCRKPVGGSYPWRLVHVTELRMANSGSVPSWGTSPASPRPCVSQSTRRPQCRCFLPISAPLRRGKNTPTYTSRPNRATSRKGSSKGCRVACLSPKVSSSANQRTIADRRDASTPRYRGETPQQPSRGFSSTLRWMWPRPESRGRNMRSTCNGFMKPCNSPCFAQLAAFFIDLRAE